MSVVDLSAARFNAAKGSDEVSVADTLAEALRRVRSEQWKAQSVIIIGMETDEDGCTCLEIMHGGPANTNERLGMYARAQELSLRNMTGDYDR